MSLSEKVMLLKSDFEEVYEAGKQTESDHFWEEFQNGGKRTDYRYGFYGWGQTYIRPKHHVRISGRTYHQSMFMGCTNLKKLEADYFSFNLPSNVSQTDQSTGHNSLFRNCSSLEEFEDLGLRAAIYYYTWSGCSSLKKIAVVRSLQTTRYTSAFNGCESLTDVTFDGVIGQNISFADCPLSVESMKSIISCLYDYSGTDSEFTYKVTFSSACITALEAEGNTSPNGNTWTEYVFDLGWNC